MTRKSRGTSAPSSPPRRPPPRPSPRPRPARRPRRRCRRARRSRRRRRSVYTTCRPRRRRRRRSGRRPRLLHRARRPRSPRRRRPRPRRARGDAQRKALAEGAKKTRGRGEEGRRRGARQKTTREAREARERRYRREIDDARRSLVEQKEMWLGLVKDSEQQCRDLELEVAEVRREEAALSAQLEDVRRNDDGAVEVLTGELVAMKLRAAELSNECDMLDHHATQARPAAGAALDVNCDRRARAACALAVEVAKIRRSLSFVLPCVTSFFPSTEMMTGDRFAAHHHQSGGRVEPGLEYFYARGARGRVGGSGRVFPLVCLCTLARLLRRFGVASRRAKTA